jgi:hypothetical protein
MDQLFTESTYAVSRAVNARYLWPPLGLALHTPRPPWS